MNPADNKHLPAATRPSPSPQPGPLPPVLARVGLRRTGVSLATDEALRLAEAHAWARDAVHSRLSTPTLLAALRELSLPAAAVHSAATSRREYLLRPDLGRALDPTSQALLQSRRPPSRDEGTPALLAIIVADGLSALAADRHAIQVLRHLLPRLGLSQGLPHSSAESTWALAPIVVAEQARVALGDTVAHLLAADASVVLLGERPGMSSPDSLGAYVTWRPRPGTPDAARNCVSNIRTGGLDYAAAAAAIAWYLNEGRRTGATGINLRAPEEPPALPRP